MGTCVSQEPSIAAPVKIDTSIPVTNKNTAPSNARNSVTKTDFPSDYEKCLENGVELLTGPLERRNYSRAAKCFEYAKTLNNKEWKANYYLSTIYLCLVKPSRFAEAIQEAEIALKSSDKMDQAQQKLMINNIEQANKEIDHVKEVKKLDSDDRLMNVTLKMKLGLGDLLVKWKLDQDSVIQISVPLKIASQALLSHKFDATCGNPDIKFVCALKTSDMRSFLEIKSRHAVTDNACPFPADMIASIEFTVKHDPKKGLPRTEVVDVEPIQDMAVLMQKVTDMSDIDPYRVRPFANPNENPFLEGDIAFQNLMASVSSPLPHPATKLILSFDYIRSNFKFQDSSSLLGPSMSDILSRGSGDSTAFSFLALGCARLLKIPSKVIYGVYGSNPNMVGSLLAVWHEKSLRWVIWDHREKLWGGSLRNFVPTSVLRTDDPAFRDDKGVFCIDFSLLWKHSSKEDLSFTVTN